MDNVIISALPAIISAAGAVVACVINSYFQSNATRNMIEYKISELTKRVEKHNNVVERMYKVEETQKVMEEQIKVANHRILDLEEVNK